MTVDSVAPVLHSEASKKRGGGVRLRAASFQDYDQIVRLESRYGLPVAKSYEEWRHLWSGNPLYRELAPDWNIGWVLEDKDHQIVGTMGNIPLLYEFEGRRILVASGRSWVAEPEYRSASLLLLDHVINQPHVDLYLNNNVTLESTAAVATFQCKPVPVGVWDQAALWITHYRGFAESFLKRKSYPLAKTLSYPLAAGAFLKERFSKNGLRPGDVEVEARQSFDERFDDFWADLKRNSPRLLLAVRTREMLEWHYKYALLNNQLWIGTVTNGSRLVAYATFDRVDRPEFKLKRVRLVDFQSLDGSTALLSPLLSWAIKKCENEGVHVLENVGRWLEKGELLEMIAPHRRRLATWRYYYRANNPALTASLTDRRAWAPSLFDGDSSLVR
jgi:hypothetical protein